MQHENAVEFAKGMLKDGSSVDIAAKYSKLPIDEVSALAKGKSLQPI